MKLKEIEQLSKQLGRAVESFNKKMPEGYFITLETDYSLLITRENDTGQVKIRHDYLEKSKLTKKEIESLFENYF